jgi:hypothetical protein
MTSSLLWSKKATCLCSGVSSPLYTSAMEEEEDPSTSTTRSLLPSPSTERSTSVTKSNTCATKDMPHPHGLSFCLLGGLLLTSVCSSFASHGGCRRPRSRDDANDDEGREERRICREIGSGSWRSLASEERGRNSEQRCSSSKPPQSGVVCQRRSGRQRGRGGKESRAVSISIGGN